MDTASDSGGLGRPQAPVLVMPLLWGPQAECQAEEDEGGEAASEDTAFKLRTFSSPKSPSGGDDCLPSGGKGTRKGRHRAGTLESRRPGVSGSSRPLPPACRACPPGPRGFSGASAGQCCLPRTLHRKRTSTRHLSLTSSVAVRAPQARGPSHRGGPLLLVLRAGRARSCVGSLWHHKNAASSLRAALQSLADRSPDPCPHLHPSEDSAEGRVLGPRVTMKGGPQLLQPESAHGWTIQ